MKGCRKCWGWEDQRNRGRLLLEGNRRRRRMGRGKRRRLMGLSLMVVVLVGECYDGDGRGGLSQAP